jgi:hypothetical protein
MQPELRPGAGSSNRTRSDPSELRGVGTVARVALLLIGVAALAADLVLRTGARFVWLTAAVLLALAVATSIASWIAWGVRRASRRNTARFGLPHEQFSTRGLLSSWTWDSLSIATLVIGVSVLAIGIVNDSPARALVQSALRFLRELAG